MGLFCFAMWILCGTIGRMGASVFVRAIFRNVKFGACLPGCVPPLAASLLIPHTRSPSFARVRSIYLSIFIVSLPRTRLIEYSIPS